MNKPIELKVRWRAQPDDMIGGWCVTADWPGTPASGLVQFANFCSREVAEHIATLHNSWLEDKRVGT